MNDLTAFNFRGNSIRTIIDEHGEPWFITKDVLSVLDLNRSSTAILDEDEKGVHSVYTPGGGQNLAIVSESGLYTLILRSRKIEALEFKRWLLREVLPSIRRHGGYLTPELTERVLSDPDTLIRLATDLKNERARRAELETKVEQDAPKVIFADAVATSRTSILVGELAKILRSNGIDMGQNRMFAWLREHGYLIKRNGTDRNMPTQRAMNLGLFEIKETAITHSDGHITVNKTPKVTGKGQRYFIDRFLGKKAA